MNAPGRCPICRASVRYEGQRFHAYEADGELHVCQVPPPLRFLACYCGSVVLVDDRTGERYNAEGNLDTHVHMPSGCEEATIDEPPPHDDTDQPPRAREGHAMPRYQSSKLSTGGVSIEIDEG